MSTTSSITAKCNDGKFRSIYCNFDGYPENNGKLLFKHYQDQQKIEDMLNLGDMSSLDISIECPDGHSYDNPVKGHCVFYGRDRGEDDIDCMVGDSLIELKNDQSYNYFWDGEKWVVNEELLSEVLEENPV